MTNIKTKYPHYHQPCPYSEIDPYRIAEIFGLNDPALFHAFKKILLCGQRGYKDQIQDVKEANDSLHRWLEMKEEDGQINDPQIEEKQIINIVEGIRNNFGDLNEFLDKLLLVCGINKESSEKIPLKTEDGEKQVLLGVMCPNCDSVVYGDLDDNQWCSNCDWTNTLQGNFCERCED